MPSVFRFLLLSWACLVPGCSADAYDTSLGDSYVLHRLDGKAPTLYYDDPKFGLFQLVNAAVIRACASTHYVLLEADQHRYVAGQRTESFYLVDKNRIKEPGHGVVGPYSRAAFQRAVQQAGTPNCLLQVINQQLSHST